MIAAEFDSEIITEKELINANGVKGKKYTEFVFVLPFIFINDTLYFFSNGDFAVESIENDDELTVTDAYYVDSGVTFYAICKYRDEDGVSYELNHYGISLGIPFGIAEARRNAITLPGVFFLSQIGTASFEEDNYELDNQLTFADLFSNLPQPLD